MNAPAGDHWLNMVQTLLHCQTLDLVELAKISGHNPKNFYRGADLRGADIRGQDLSLLDLTDADLSDVIMDGFTRISDEFSPINSGSLIFRHAELPLSLYSFLNKICSIYAIPHKSKSIRFLIQNVYKEFRRNPEIYDSYVSYLNRSDIKNRYFFLPRQGRRHLKFQISEKEHAFVMGIGKNLSGLSAGYTAVIVIGAMILSDDRIERMDLGLPVQLSLDFKR